MAKEMTREMNEAQRVGLLRNAILVAGYEMGEEGEHWPVINDTIHKIARDWEESKLQKDADAEMKIHAYEQLDVIEQKIAQEPDTKLRQEMKIRFDHLRESFDAYFSPVDNKAIIPLSDEEIPDYIKRVDVIISTLGGHDD